MLHCDKVQCQLNLDLAIHRNYDLYYIKTYSQRVVENLYKEHVHVNLNVSTSFKFIVKQIELLILLH